MNVLCDSVESVTRVVVNCCVECVSRWVPVALSSIIDFTRSENEREGGGSIHTIQWGEFTQRGPFNWGKTHAYIHSTRGAQSFVNKRKSLLEISTQSQLIGQSE